MSQNIAKSILGASTGCCAEALCGRQKHGLNRLNNKRRLLFSKSLVKYIDFMSRPVIIAIETKSKGGI